MANAQSEVSMQRTLDALRREARASGGQENRPASPRTSPPAHRPVQMPQEAAGPQPGSYQPDEISPTDQIEKGRELYQQRQQDQIEQARSQTTPIPAAPEAAPAQGRGEEREDQRSSAFSRLRQLAQQFRRERPAQASTGEADAATQAAAVQGMRGLWTAIHETLEDTALSLVDFMIITGPLAIGAYFLRLGAYLYGRLFTIRFKGAEVPLIPTFATGEFLVRSSKILVVLAVTAVVWGAILIVVWIFSDPVEAAKVLTKVFVNSICGDCLK